MAPKRIGEVVWHAFRVDKRAQAAWLRDPPQQQAPAYRALCANPPAAALLADVDKNICERRDKLMRAERKISDAVGRSAAAGDIDRLRRKAQKQRLRLDQALEDKRYLLARCERPQTAFAPPTGGAANTGAPESAQLPSSPSVPASRSVPMSGTQGAAHRRQPAGSPRQGTREANPDVSRRAVCEVMQPAVDLACTPCECTDDVLVDLPPSRPQLKTSYASAARGEAARLGRSGGWSTVFV